MTRDGRRNGNGGADLRASGRRWPGTVDACGRFSVRCGRNAKGSAWAVRSRGLSHLVRRSIEECSGQAQGRGRRRKGSQSRSGGHSLEDCQSQARGDDACPTRGNADPTGTLRTAADSVHRDCGGSSAESPVTSRWKDGRPDNVGAQSVANRFGAFGSRYLSEECQA